MKIKWNDVSRFARTSDEYNEFERLKTYFQDSDVDYLALIEYYINQYGKNKNYNRRYTNVNRLIKHTGIKIPPQHSTMYKRPKEIVPLAQFLKNLRRVCPTHSEYAFASCALFYSIKYLFKATIDDYRNLYDSAPKWLKFILNRQKRLCDNISLLGSDPFFFVMRGKNNKNNFFLSSVKGGEWRQINYNYESLFEITITNYITYYNLYMGMAEDAWLMHGSNSDMLVELNKRHRRSVGTFIKLLKINDNGKRSPYDCGYCVKEIEPGIYIVDGINDIYIVPFYLMDMLSANKLEIIFSKGYVTPEQEKVITDSRDFVSHRFKAHKLKR